MHKISPALCYLVAPLILIKFCAGWGMCCISWIVYRTSYMFVEEGKIYSGLGLRAVAFINWIMGIWNLGVLGCFSFEKVKIDVDYKEYLGPDSEIVWCILVWEFLLIYAKKRLCKFHGSEVVQPCAVHFLLSVPAKTQNQTHCHSLLITRSKPRKVKHSHWSFTQKVELQMASTWSSSRKEDSHHCVQYSQWSLSTIVLMPITKGLRSRSWEAWFCVLLVPTTPNVNTLSCQYSYPTTGSSSIIREKEKRSGRPSQESSERSWPSMVTTWHQSWQLRISLLIKICYIKIHKARKNTIEIDWFVH